MDLQVTQDVHCAVCVGDLCMSTFESGCDVGNGLHPIFFCLLNKTRSGWLIHRLLNGEGICL